jgi:CRISPR-associated Cas5-like protein
MDNSVCLGLRIHVPFWCSFRDPLTSNVHRTFPIPPPTTLYGLCAAALGLAQDDISRRHQMRFAIAVEREGELVETYSTWKKAGESPKGEAQKVAFAAIKARGNLAPDEAQWISTPIIRQKLIQPVYTIGIWTSKAVSEELQTAFKSPTWPLYLGESDDGIDVEILGEEIPRSSTQPATGAVEGIQGGGILASLPRQFKITNKKWELERWLVTVPKAGHSIQTSLELWECHGHVWSFEPEFPPSEEPTLQRSSKRSKVDRSEINSPDASEAQGQLF